MDAQGSGPVAKQVEKVAGQADGGSTPGSMDVLARGAILVAFPYDPRPAQVPGPADQPGGPEPCLRVGAFAASHYYTALARLLKGTARKLATHTGYPYASFRVAVNSRLPEKNLAELAGLGYRGRSDLLLSHAYGPACILGVLLLPFDPSPATSAGGTADRPRGTGRKSACSSCHACADSCPGSAIDGNNVGRDAGKPTNRAADRDKAVLPATYHREACIQHWMQAKEDPPEALRPALSGRLYGCDACILACPCSAGAWLPDRVDGSSPASRADALLLPVERRPGPFIPASFLLSADDDELKAAFRKTALGLSWFGPSMIRRNAALATHDSSTVKRAEI